ncbi:MAG: hypothetical protein GOMPHAMPRED_005901 [Gomphillus americanus]|uniref:Uncharacterized protein n=1 Tax=Gomphillus americanus TaxID=1940652 RepID=A0A8H3FYI9_9LECA|nr:MAG: hypothetical protein GOMPHAMPRED_005901 [Gomphillus americanus]
MSSPSTQTILTVRRAILTFGVIGISATGTILGAHLKDNQIAIKRQEAIKKATPEEIIASYEWRIHDLQRTRSEILRKIENVDADIEMKANKKAGGGGGGG